MICVGCGENLSNPKERRSLSNPDASDVASLWRSLVENDEQLKERVDVDKILGEEDCQMLPKMCRKCFTAYRSCSKSYAILATKLKKAFDEEIAAAKRPKLSSTSCQFSQSSAATSTQSPDVDVSWSFLKAL